jgi:hypothetical protein
MAARMSLSKWYHVPHAKVASWAENYNKMGRRHFCSMAQLTKAAEMIGQYQEYCTMFRVQKPNSAVIAALFDLHRRQTASAETTLPKTVADSNYDSAEDDLTNSAVHLGGENDADGPLVMSSLPRLTALDLSRTYLGPRGLLALAALTKHLGDLQFLNLTGAQWFNGDETVGAPDGAETFALVCELLADHPTLSCLTFGDTLFGPAQYLRLVSLLKASPALTSIAVTSPLLQPHENLHLRTLAAINQKRGAAQDKTGLNSMGNEAAFGDCESAPRSPTSAVQAIVSSANVFAPSATTAASRRAGGIPGRVEALVRIRGEPTASLILGAADVTNARVAHPAPSSKSVDTLERLNRIFELNAVLRHCNVSDRAAMVIPALRLAYFREDDIILEQHDPVDCVVVLARGGAIAARSDDLSMHYPVGSIIGDEELMPGTATDTRRFTSRAKSSLQAAPLYEMILTREEQRRGRRGTVATIVTQAKQPGVSVSSVSVPPLDEQPAHTTTGDHESDVGCEDEDYYEVAPVHRCKPQAPSKVDTGTVEAWIIPRVIFSACIARPANDHRIKHRHMVETWPSLQGLGTIAKLAIADALDERVFVAHEVVSAGFAMLSDVFFIVEGSAAVYFQHTEVKRLVRGEVFVCHPATDVARCSVVAHDHQLRVVYIAEGRFRALPLHVQHHFSALARTYSLLED